MVWPSTWFDPYGRVGQNSYQQCITGACMWFSNYTFVEEKTLPEDLRTYRDAGTYFDRNPWLSPGKAEIFSPCGIDGGNPNGCGGVPQGQPCPGGGTAYGPDARKVKFNGVKTTNWKRGSVQEAAWSIIANHGGGYSYRLCRVPAEGVAGLTEECFNHGHLEFFGEKQWAQWGSNKNNRTEIIAKRTTKGTFPKGSEWTMNPIPACSSIKGGGYNDKLPNCQDFDSKPQFTPPGKGLVGFGERNFAPGKADFGFNIVDKLKVPASLVPGMYILSHRWDCEQSSQVWNTCANIKITL